jgi:hypothetical protein
VEIGRLIERNVFTFLWLFFFLSFPLGYLIGFDYFGSEWQSTGFFYLYYASKYIVWPTHFLFSGGAEAYILSCLCSLTVCIIADFLWRKIFWNKRKIIDTALTKNVGKSSKKKSFQIVTVIVTWVGRLLTCLLIPFLMFTIDSCVYHCNKTILTSASVEILGCIIGWRFPLVGAVILLAGIISFHILEGKIIFDCYYILIDLAAVAFFATWILKKFSKRELQRKVSDGTIH